MHDEIDVQSATLPMASTKTARANRNKMHVQFNDKPTIIHPTNSTNTSNSLINSVTSSNASIDQQVNANESLDKKESVQINVDEKTNNITSSENEENIPPPINLATLPPRSSLLANYPSDIPLHLLSYDNVQSENTENDNYNTQCKTQMEYPISLIGNIIQEDKNAANEKILVSTAYTNLPSPLTVPILIPTEINSVQTVPLVLNTTLPKSSTGTTYKMPVNYLIQTPVTSNISPVTNTEISTTEITFIPCYQIQDSKYNHVVQSNTSITNNTSTIMGSSGFPNTFGMSNKPDTKNESFKTNMHVPIISDALELGNELPNVRILEKNSNYKKVGFQCNLNNSFA